MSLKPTIVKEAKRRTGASTICFLDSDTIVCNQLTLPPDGELFALPEMYPKAHISSNIDTVWRSLYQKAEIDFPSNTIESLFYKNNITPYYNAGVLIFRSIDISEEWLSLQKLIIPEVEDPLYTDQLSISMLSTKYDTRSLNIQQHCPLGHVILPHPDVEVLHYWEGPSSLLQALFQWNYFEEIGIDGEFEHDWNGIQRVKMFLRSATYASIRRMIYKVGTRPPWA